jgi:hypothetical protein
MMVEFIVWKIELQNMLVCIKLQVMNDMSLSEVPGLCAASARKSTG